jgi:putative restriction endonuclease
MEAEELKKRILHLSIWKKDGVRAPHKPLLLLYALGQFQNGTQLSLPYNVLREKLKNLLIEFGPPRQSYHPEQPFVRLENDGIWKLNKQVDKRNFTDKQLITNGIIGGFTDEVVKMLMEQRGLRIG